jgi:hypothetical protein
LFFKLRLTVSDESQYGLQDLMNSFNLRLEQTHDAKQDAKDLRTLVDKANRQKSMEWEEDFLMSSFKETSEFFN